MSARFISGALRVELQAQLDAACDAMDGDAQAWGLLNLQRTITNTLAARLRLERGELPPSGTAISQISEAERRWAEERAVSSVPTVPANWRLDRATLRLADERTISRRRP